MTDFIIKYWIEALFTGFLGLLIILSRLILGAIKKFFKELLEDIKELKKDSEISKRANRAILKDRLSQKIEYHLDIEYCDMKSREVIAELYAEYKNNGGNGGMNELMEKVCNLPTKEGGQ
jgi:hypothetical protein